MLCVLIYLRTNCGLRSVITIIGAVRDVFGPAMGRVPSYNSVANWVRKLGLSVYEDAQPRGEAHVQIIDESIALNKHKLLLMLGIKAAHDGKPLGHKDVTVLGMRVGESFTRKEVKEEIEKASAKAGAPPEYGISDRQAALLADGGDVRHISSDIVESDFGIFKAKKSPNKLYGITSLALMLPLYPKIADSSCVRTFAFKSRLANVKLKDIDAWAKDNLPPNPVAIRTRTLQNAS